MVSIPRIQRQQVPVANAPPAIQAPTQTAVGQGEQILGAVLQDIGFPGIERQNRAVVTQAEAAARRTMLEAFNGNKDTPGLDQMQGPVYLEAAPRVLEGLDEQFKAISSALTPQQQAAFAPKLERIRTAAQTSVRGKAAKVSDQIAHAAYVNNLESLHETALYAADNVPFDPTTGEMDVSAVERVLGGDGSGRPGYGGADEAIKDYAYDNAHLLNEPVEEWVERAQTEFRSQIHSQAIQNALQDGDPDGARRYFKKVRDDMLGPDVELAETDVGKATAIMDAEAVARESLSSRPPLLTRNKAEEAARLGTTYTSESARYAEGLADAIEDGGPSAGEAFKAAYKEQQDQIKRAYSEQLSDTTELLRDVNYDFDELMKRDGARMNELYSAKDVAALEKLAKTEREGVQADSYNEVQYELELERATDPDAYVNKTASDWLKIASQVGVDNMAKLRGEQQKFIETGSSDSPSISDGVEAWRDQKGEDKLWAYNLRSYVADQVEQRMKSNNGKPLSPEEVRTLIDGAVREDGFYRDYSIDLPGPTFLTTPEEASGAFSPEIVAQARDELASGLPADAPEPSERQVVRYLLDQYALFGTDVAGVGLEPAPGLPPSAGEAAVSARLNEVGGLAPDAFVGSFGAETEALLRGERVAEDAAYLAQDERRAADFNRFTSLRRTAPEVLMEAVDRTERYLAPGETSALREAVEAGKAEPEQIRTILANLEVIEREESRAALPTLERELGGAREADAVLEGIRTYDRRSYRELFEVPVSELTPEQRIRARALYDQMLLELTRQAR